MVTAATIRDLEILADEAWPAAEVEDHDGWQFRWAEGPWNRTNSVATHGAGTEPLPDKIDRAERWYLDRDRMPVFKLTAATQPADLDRALETRGYTISFAVSVETKPVTPAPPVTGVEISGTAEGPWLESKRRIAGPDSDRPRHLPMLLARIDAPVGFAWIEGSRGPVAVGMAVITRGHVGIFDLATDPAARGKGAATAIVTALESWGASGGAATAYLQVETGNAAAQRLYDRLGYREAYRYWYRKRGNGNRESGTEPNPAG